MTAARLTFHLGLAAALAGCKGEPWVVAAVVADAAADAGDAGPDAALPECPSAESLVREELAGLPRPALEARHVGTWRGGLHGVSSPAFPGARLELQLAPDGSGTLRFIDAALPPAPADATAGYACQNGETGVTCGSASGFVGGYPYALYGARSRGAVLSFTLLGSQPWDSFCKLAPPLEWPDVNAACGFSHGVLPPGSSSWSTQGCTHVSDTTTTSVDCEWLYAVRRCQCAFDGCFSSFQTRVALGLELVDADRELQGSLWSFDGTRAVTLRLWRVGP